MQPNTKKMKRMERKKKKLAALIEITELNNKDRAELESVQPYVPDDDNSMIMDESKSKKSSNNQSTTNFDLSQDDSGEVSEDNSVLEEDESSTHRKSKKKRKSKHEEDHVRRQKSKPTENEEWPQLSPNAGSVGYRQKRKSTFELEIQKERPEKMVKRHSEYNQRSQPLKDDQKSSFTDDLESLRKDIELSKSKREKKKKHKEKIIDKQHYEESIQPETTAENNGNQDVGINTDDHATEEADDEEGGLNELRKLLKQRKKQLKELPLVRLKGPGREADLDLSVTAQRTPIIPCDVQHLLLFSQLGHDCPRFPRWVELKKWNRISKTVVLVVEGASAYDYYSNESSCPMLAAMDVKVEVVCPYRYNANVAEELCAVPITRQQKKELEKRFGKEICPEALLTDRIIKVLRSAFSISSVPKTQSEQVEQKISVPTTDKFPRTELLLSAWQLIEEGYPLPYDSSSDLGNRYPDYVMTKKHYAEVTPNSPMWGLDCEMCLTRVGNELTRVSVVDEHHKTVYESFCLPRNPIINYLTEFSGITPAMLKGVTTRIEDVQRELQELFPPDVILVGQSLGGDLHALKMMHPYVIDTSVVFNLTGNRRHKSKLSKLTLEFLNEAIQQRGAAGHDSVEDSLAALKLVQHKLTKSIEYGDAVLSGLTDTPATPNQTVGSPTTYQEHHVGDFEALKVEVGPTMATSLFKHLTMRKKSISVVGQEEMLAEYSSFIAAANKENKQLVSTHTTDSNEETIEVACRQCKNTNFTMAHVILDEEDNIMQVDSWMRQLFNSPPFNSLFIVLLVGGHTNNTNGACLVTVKKPNLKLKPRKAD